jgi:hypothetical protein
MGAGFWADVIEIRAAQVVLAAGWGERPMDVLLRPVPGLSLSGRRDPLPTRPLRPVFPVRGGAEGALAVLADTEDGLEARRFLHQRLGGPVRALQVGRTPSD